MRLGNVFTPVCHSVHRGGCVSQHALGQTPPWADISQHALGQTPLVRHPTMHWGRQPPWADISQYALGQSPPQADISHHALGQTLPPGQMATAADTPLGQTYPSMHWGSHPPQADISHHALGQTLPPRADGYCCGRYTSYWNAFLLLQCCRYHFTMTVNLDC